MKNFDEKIREKLFDAELPVAEHLWAGIESQIVKNDGRHHLWLFFFLLLCVVPLSLFYIAYGKEDLSISDSNITAYWDELDHDINGVASFQEYASQKPLKTINNLTQNSIIHNSDYEIDLSFQIVSGNKSKFESINDKILNKSPYLTSVDNPKSLITNELQPDRLSAMKLLKKQETQCPSFKPGWPGMYSYFNSTLSMPVQLLSAPNSEFDNYLAQRRATESALPSYSFEIGLGMEFKNGLFLQGGLMYDQINIKFLQVEEDVINNKTSIVIDTLFNTEGEVLSISRDTTVVQEIGVREVVATNTFKQIDIPVWLGYKYALSNKSDISLSAGMIFNISSRSKGYMIDDQGNALFYSNQDNEQFYKNRLGLSFASSILYHQELDERFSVHAGLNMRYYGAKLNLEENPVNQKFIRLGLTAGINFRI